MWSCAWNKQSSLQKSPAQQISCLAQLVRHCPEDPEVLVSIPTRGNFWRIFFSLTCVKICQIIWEKRLSWKTQLSYLEITKFILGTFLLLFEDECIITFIDIGVFKSIYHWWFVELCIRFSNGFWLFRFFRKSRERRAQPLLFLDNPHGTSETLRSFLSWSYWFQLVQTTLLRKTPGKTQKW